jgi:hypothetical protein
MDTKTKELVRKLRELARRKENSRSYGDSADYDNGYDTANLGFAEDLVDLLNAFEKESK